MWRLIQVFSEIALHRRDPSELPASRFLLSLTFVTYLAVGFISLLVGAPAESLIGCIILESFFYLWFIWLVLIVFNRSNRFLQTATALLGTETLLGIIRMPILAWVDATRTSGGEPTAGAFVYFLLLLWSIDVAGFVLSRALQNAYFVGVLIVMGYVAISFTLREYFFPVIG